MHIQLTQSYMSIMSQKIWKNVNEYIYTFIIAKHCCLSYLSCKVIKSLEMWVWERMRGNTSLTTWPDPTPRDRGGKGWPMYFLLHVIHCTRCWIFRHESTEHDSYPWWFQSIPRNHSSHTRACNSICNCMLLDLKYIRGFCSIIRLHFIDKGRKLKP